MTRVLKDALQGAVCGCSGLTTEISWHESMGRLCFGDGGQQFSGLCNGVVVVGDGIVVSAFEGPDLGPASVGKLGGEEIADSLEEAGLICTRMLRSSGNDEREEAKLGGSGVVVEGADVVPVGIARSVEVAGAGGVCLGCPGA